MPENVLDVKISSVSLLENFSEVGFMQIFDEDAKALNKYFSTFLIALSVCSIFPLLLIAVG